MAELVPSVADAPDEKDPTGPDPEGDLFRRLKGYVTSSLEHLSDWREEAEEAFKFYSGDQWTEEELTAFKQDSRVAPIFNLTAVNVDAVCGLEVNNRQDVKYLPRTPGDVQVNELLSSAAMWVRDQAQSEDEESDAFRDAVITGLGVTESRKSDPETISVDRRDPVECFYDKTAKKPNIIDRRYGGRIVMMDRDEAENLFPDQDAIVLDAKWARLGTKSDKVEESLDYPDHQRTGTGLPEGKPKKVCLVEIEWYDWEGGKKAYKQAFLGATTVLEVNPLEAWAYNFITGKRDQKKNSWYGIVRALRDPQKVVNKFLATGIHIMASNAKGGLLYERGSFIDQRQSEKDWSNPQKNVEVTEGALTGGKIQPRLAPPLPTGLTQIIDLALQLFGKVSGINVELLGAADRDQPASLEMQRRQSAVTILASLFDSKRRYHKEQGRTLLALMRTLPPETLVRVTIDQPQSQPSVPQFAPPASIQMQGQGQAPVAPNLLGSPSVTQGVQPSLNGMPDPAQQQAEQQKREMFVQFQMISQALSDESIKFDVIVDEAPTSPNQQQEVLAKLSLLTQHGMALPPEAQAIIVKAIGLPSTIADDIAKAISGQNPQVQALQQQLQQGAQLLQETQQQLAQEKTNNEAAIQKAQTDDYNAQTQRLKVDGESIEKTGSVIRNGQQTPVVNYVHGLEAAIEQLHKQMGSMGMAA